MPEKFKIPWATFMRDAGLRRKWYSKNDEGLEMFVVTEGLDGNGNIVEVEIPVESFLHQLGIELVDAGPSDVTHAPPGTTLAHRRAAEKVSTRPSDS